MHGASWVFTTAALVALLAGSGLTPAVAQTSSAAVLAPVGRQLAWLSLEAPRPRILTNVGTPDYVSEVAATPGSNVAAVVLVRATPASGVPSGEVVTVDLTTLATTPLVGDAALHESLGAPQWWPDNSRLVYQREDVSVIGSSYAGGATIQYPSRVEQVNADGSGRSIVIDNARQPAIAPEGQSIAYVRRSAAGSPMLVVRSARDGLDQVLIDGGFGDIVSPRYAPQGDRIAFAVPAAQFASASVEPIFDMLRVARAETLHGAPWDIWTVPADGSAPATRLAALGADDATLAWSPDGSRVFVYGGTGSFIVDARTRDVTPLTFLSGYGTPAWIAD